MDLETLNSAKYTRNYKQSYNNVMALQVYLTELT